MGSPVVGTPGAEIQILKSVLWWSSSSDSCSGSKFDSSTVRSTRNQFLNKMSRTCAAPNSESFSVPSLDLEGVEKSLNLL